MNKVDIHVKINAKGDLEYFDTPIVKMVGGMVIIEDRAKFRKATNKVRNYVMLDLFMEGERAYFNQMSGGRSYCPECSSERGRGVYHYTNNEFGDFLSRWKRYGSELNKIKEGNFF